MLKANGPARRLLKSISPLRVTGQVRSVLARYRRWAWRLEGHERGSGRPLTVVFAGQLQNKNYIAHLAFAEAPVERALGRQWLWSVLPRSAAHSTDSTDLRIIELFADQRQLLRGRFHSYIPCWVDGEIDLRAAMAHFRRSRHDRNELNRIRRDGLTYEIASSREAFEHFYFGMYLPYVGTRHGDRALPMTYEEMMRERDHSELLLVTIRGETVGGSIIVYENGGARRWSKGVKEGICGTVKARAQRALEYFPVYYLAEKGFASVHMGGSRPFLNDGVLRNKRRLGLCITGHAERGFALQVALKSAGAEAFLLHNPFIFEHDGRYAGAVFVDGQRLPSAEEMRRLPEEYGIRGMDSVVVFALPGWKEVGRIRVELEKATPE